jgi:hypothetical protein
VCLILSILKIISISAQKLSDPNEEPIVEKRLYSHLNESFSLLAINSIVEESTTRNWKEVVQKRIEKKTRIISKVFFFGLKLNFFFKVN